MLVPFENQVNWTSDYLERYDEICLYARVEDVPFEVVVPYNFIRVKPVMFLSMQRLCLCKVYATPHFRMLQMSFHFPTHTAIFR